MTLRRGAILPLVAIMLPVLILLAGIAINIAYIQLTSTQLQISTDIAAKASGRHFAENRDKDAALALANQFGSLNKVAGQPLEFRDQDLQIGTSTLATDGTARYNFTPDDGSGSAFCNAVEIVGSRANGSASGNVSTYFPSLVGQSTFELTTTSVSTQVEVDLVLVLDRSGSMAYADDEAAVYPPIPIAAPDGWYFGDFAPANARWRDAVVATNVFLGALSTSPLREQVSLVTYADTAKIDQSLTEGYGLITTQLNNYTVALPGGGTNIGAGMQAAQAELASSAAREFSAKVCIVLTDGKNSVGPNPIDWAHNLANDGIMIITVTFAAEADQALMQNIANIGNGFHVHADSSDALTDAFSQIGRQLPTLLTR